MSGQRMLRRGGIGRIVGTGVGVALALVLALVRGPTEASHTTFVVTSAADSTDNNPGDGNCVSGAFGVCTLRAAIQEANAHAGADTIHFSLVAGNRTINVGNVGLGALPAITEAVTINGNTGGATRIELNGASAGSGAMGLRITGGSSSIRSLVINRFSYGISLQSNGNSITDNLVGTDNSGTADLGNVNFGVSVSGQNNVLSGNVISGNYTGVEVSGAVTTGNTVSGNYIGTDLSGLADLGNSTYGVLIEGADSNTIGGTAAGAGNVISGNDLGGIRFEYISSCVPVACFPQSNTIAGNYIGTNAGGAGAIGNGGYGIDLYIATMSCIGGVVVSQVCTPTAGAGNVISGNGSSGIFGPPASAANDIYGNRIGTNAAGTGALANGGSGIQLAGYNSTIGGGTPEARNVISGNTQHGILLGGTYSSNTVQGNYIGLNATGTSPIGNGGDGIRLEGSIHHCIGSELPPSGGSPCSAGSGAGNVISANGSDGIQIVTSGASQPNLVLRNRIGTNAAGSAGVPNGQHGIHVGSPGNRIGLAVAGTENTIAFNTFDGVRVVGPAATGNEIRSNSIHSNGGPGINLGTDAVTANDTGDADAGPNNLQNFPVLTAATPSGGSTTVVGSLNSTATTSFIIEFFSNPSCDPSGNGEGETFLGSGNYTTDGSGNVSFTQTGLAATTSGHFVTATATRSSAPPDTSEFSACRVVAADADLDGVPDGTDNCPNASNPTQLNTDGDSQGDACDADDDNDGVSDNAEPPCGSDPLDVTPPLSRPERVDGPFAGVDDDGDTLVDEALPGGAANFDCDGDGYKGSAEDQVFSYLPQTNADQKTCQEYDATFPNQAPHIRPSKRWPSDIASSAFSLNKINIQDLSSFTNPIRYLNKDVGTNPNDVRFDLVPGSTIGADINVADLAAMTGSSSTGYPPMLGGLKAFGGPVCPYAP